jgi:GT2 family glycosyltransferase
VRPRISVITPTHNRSASLRRLLDALRGGGIPESELEVVVVADGCSDDTVEVVRGYDAGFAVHLIEQNPGRGAAAARNRGAERASADILLFIDDDIEPIPGMLGAHLRAHADAENAVVIGPPLPVRDRAADLHSIAAWGWWEEQFARMRQPGHRFTYDEVFSGVLSVRAELFRTVHGFDVEFDNCRDDSELGLKLLRAGARIRFEPAAAGWHHELRDGPRLVRRKRAEGKADVRLARLHPDVFPVLRLAQQPYPYARVLAALRRLAFAAPWVGDRIADLLTAMLRPLERLRMRGMWSRAQAGVMYYWYWRGAAGALKGEQELRELHANAQAAARAYVMREIDLRDGIDSAAAELDAEPADGVVLLNEGIEVGRIPPLPGAEPLRGVHLRRAVATTLRPVMSRIRDLELATDAQRAL